MVKPLVVVLGADSEPERVSSSGMSYGINDRGGLIRGGLGTSVVFVLLIYSVSNMDVLE